MPAASTDAQPGPACLLRRLVASEFLVPALGVVLFLALAPSTPGLATTENLGKLLANLAPLLILALGQTLVLIAGGIDLSTTSTVALASVTGAFVMSGDGGWLAGHPLAVPVALAAMLLLGAMVGAVNGLAVAVLRLPAFIVTLTTMMFVSGLAIWLTQSSNIRNLPAAFIALGRNVWPALLFAGALGAVTHLLLQRSLFGQWLRAVGFNARTARVSGVPVAGVLIGAFVASGVLAAAASMLYTARLETGSPVLGQRLLLDVMGAAVLGGTSLFGGRGRVLWTLGGALFLTLLDNILNLRGCSQFTTMMVKGAVILAAAVLDAVRHRLEGRR